MDNPQFQEIVKDLKKKNKAVKDRHQSLSDQGVVIKSLDAVQNAVIRSIEVLVTSLLEDTLKTRVVNQIEMPKNIGTPDALAGAQRVEQAVTQLKQAIVGKDIDLSGVVGHLEAISGTLAKLPTQYPSFPKMPSEMAVNNLSEVCDKLDLLGIELQNLKLDPKIDVKAPEIKIDLSKELKQIETAIKSISQEVKIPEYKQDNTDIVKAMKDVKKTIESIQFPVPNFRTEDIVNAINNISVGGGGGGGAAKTTDTYGWQATSEDSTFKYFYFENASKAWYILRKHKTNKVATYWSGTGGYESVYVSPTAGPSGTPVWDSYGDTF